MDKRMLASFLLVGIVGIFLLGKGFTGMAVSESCCFGPDCTQLCDEAEATQPEMNLGAHFNFLLGAVMLLTSIYGIAWTTAAREPQE